MQAADTVETYESEQDFNPLIHASQGARNRSGAHKIAGATLIELLSGDAVQFLGAEVVGCLFLMLQKMLSAGTTSVQYPAAVRHIHIHAKVRQDRAKEILGLLLDAEVVSATGGETQEGLIHIPALSRAVEAVEGERSRRIQGWDSRRKGAADKAVPAARVESDQPASLAPGEPDSPANGEGDDFSFSAAEPVALAVAGVLPDEDLACTNDDLMGAVSLMADDVADEGASTSAAAVPAVGQSAPTENAGDLFPVEGERIHYLAHEKSSRDRVVEIVAVDGTIVRVTRCYIDWLQQAVPNVDVEQQTRLAAAWCQENKSRRKTVKRMGAFLLSWMSRHSSSLRIQQAAAEHSSRRGQFGSGQVAQVTPGAATFVAPFDDDIGDLGDLEMLAIKGESDALSFPI